MKIILSPAKKMIVDTDNLAPVELPVYIDKTAEVLNWMKSKSKEELKAIWKCNDKIAEQNFNRLENMDLYNRLTPAVLAYEGIAFQYMAPSVFEIRQFEYLQNHLRILSAFYGILKPMETDDMLIIRGVNVFPSQIESALLSVDSKATNYFLEVDRVNNLDTLEVQVEMREDMFGDEIKTLEAYKKKVKAAIDSAIGVGVSVKLVEPKTLARSTGKAVRVNDKRAIKNKFTK